MSSPSLKLSTELTPVEKADNLEDVQLGPSRQSQQSFGTKGNNSTSNAWQNIVVLQGFKTSHSDGTVTSSDVPHNEMTQISQIDGTRRWQELSLSDGTKSQEIVENQRAEQDFSSTRRSSKFVPDEDDNLRHSDDETSKENVYNYNDNKNDMEMNNLTDFESYGDTHDGSKHTSVHFVEKTESKVKSNDNITKNNVKDRFLKRAIQAAGQPLVKRVIQTTGQPLGRANRVSTLSRSWSVAKTKSVKNRSSVSQDAQTSSNNVLKDPFPSRELEVKGLAEVTGQRSSFKLPKENPEAKLKFAFDNESGGKKHEQWTGNKHIIEDDKVDDDTGGDDALGDPLGTFHLDMTKGADNNHEPEVENTHFGKVNHETKGGEDDTSDKYFSGNSISEISSSDNTNTRNSNSSKEELAIQKHGMAINDAVDYSFKPTKNSDTFGIDFEKDDTSADSKSISSPTHLHNLTDESSKHNYIAEGGYQNDSTSNVNKRSVEDPSDMEYSIDTNFIDTSIILQSDEQDNGMSDRDERRDDIIRGVVDNDLVESDENAEKNITDTSSAFSNNINNISNNVKEGDEESEETTLLHPYLQKSNRKQDNININSKDGPVNLTANRSNLAPGNHSKIPVSNKHVNYQTIVEMRAIERLLTGPYSESMNQKTPSTRSGTYGNPTKSSVSKTQIQKTRNKVKFNEDKEIWKTQSAKGSRTNSVRASNRQTRSAKSDEVRSTMNSAKSHEVRSTMSSAKSCEVKSTTRTNTHKYSESKNAAHKDRKPIVLRAPKRKLDHPKTEPNVSAKEAFVITEEGDQAETLTYPDDKQDATIATVISDSGEKQNTETVTDEAGVYMDVVDTAEPEPAQQENMEVAVDNTPPEITEPEVLLENRQFESGPAEIINVNIVEDEQKEPESKSEKRDNQTIKEKPTTLSEWFKAKKKAKKHSPKLVKKQSTKYRTSQKNEPKQSVKVKNIFRMSVKDKQGSLESAIEKPDKAPPPPIDSSDTPPATVVIVDETSAAETKSSTLVGQVILNGFLNKFKSKSTPDNKNSAAPPSTNVNPTPLILDSILANGVGKQHDRSTAKSVSIHSLTVPGLPHNQFSGDSAIDEDSISVYSRRDSTRQSFDSGSRKSVDYRIRNTALVVLPTVDEKPKSNFNNDESFIKNAIPFLPMHLAVLCLVLNIVVPGSGTALSGMSILCCGQPRLSNKDDQMFTTFCANFMVGLAQLFTVTFLLVGWFWSIGWGIQMVMLSVQHEKEMKEQRAKELQSLALSALGSPKRSNMFDT